VTSNLLSIDYNRTIIVPDERNLSDFMTYTNGVNAFCLKREFR